MAVTRIQNNQITDSTITQAKIAPYTLTGGLFANTITLNSNVTITGNLTLQGSTDSISATNTYVNDPLVVFNNGFGGAPSYDIGILVNRNLTSTAPYGSVNAAWIWREADQAFEGLMTTETGATTGSINNSGYANVKIGNTTAVSGTITNALSVGTTLLVTGATTLSSTLGVTGISTLSGNVVAASGTTSTNTTTGALVVVGGAGISGRLNVGGDITVTGNVIPSANVTYNLGSTTGQWKDLYLSGSTIYLGSATIGTAGSSNNATLTLDGASGNTLITATTASSNTTTGALVVKGGAGVVGALNVGSTIIAGGNVVANSGTASSNQTTGALVVAGTGGLGVGGSIYAGNIYDNGTRVYSTTTGTGNLAVSGSQITLALVGPGAITVGSATSVPVVTTDTYGRVVALTSSAISTTYTLNGTTGTTSVTNGSTLNLAGTYGVTVAVGTEYANIATPQDLQTTASPTFNGLTTKTQSTGGLQAVAIGNVTPGTAAFTTVTTNTETIGGLQAVAIGNVTPGTAAFTTVTANTETVGGLQAVAIGNVTPGTGAFTTLSAGSANFAAINNTPVGNATPSTGFFTQLGSTTTANLNTVTTASVQGVIGNVTPAAATFTTVTAQTETLGGLQAVAIGNVTPGTAQFTTLGTTGATTLNTVTGASFQGAVGNATPNTGAFTTLTASSATTFTSTVDTTGPSNGAVVISGGLGIAKALQVGGDAIIAGNLAVSGTFEYINTKTTTVTDPIIELNTGANGAPLSGAVAFDSGVKAHYWNGADASAFFGRANDTGSFEYYSTVTSETGNTISGVYGTIKSGALTLANARVVGGGLSANTGALQVWGDASVTGNLYVGAAFLAGTASFAAINNTPIGNATPSTGAFTTLSATGSTTLNTVTGASFQGVIGNVTPATAVFTTVTTNTETIGGLQAVAIGNVTPGTATFTTATTGGLQAVAIGNVTPGTAQFTTLGASGASTLNTITGASFQGVIGNVTPASATFTTVTTNAETIGGLQAVAIGNVTPGTAQFTTLGASGQTTLNTATAASVQGVIGNVTPATGYFTTLIATTVNAATIGNISANVVGTGTYLTNLTAQNINGTVATANVALYEQLTNSTTNGTFYVPFYDKATGNASAYTNSSINLNPSTGALSATTFYGAGTGLTGSASSLSIGGSAPAGSLTGATLNSGVTTSSLTTVGTLGTLAVSGVTTIGGNVVITSGGLADPATNNTGALVITGQGGIYAGGNISLRGQGFFGPGTHLTSLANAPLVTTGSVNSYVQVSVQNNSNGTAASSDFVATADTGTDGAKYIDVGINNSGFTASGTWTMSGALDGYMYVNSGNLTVGTDTLNKTVSIHTGGTFANNVVATFNANNVQPTSSTTGAVVIPSGGLGVYGNINVGGGTVFNSSQTAGNDVIARGKNDATLIWARPNATYDTVIIGNSATASTAVNGSKLVINTTDSIMLPVGTSSQRPSAVGYSDVAGMLRYNTTLNSTEFYTGAAWSTGAATFTVISDQQFTGTGSQTVFTLGTAVTTSAAIVSINGVVQIPTLAYACFSGNSSIVFTEAPASTDVIDVRTLVTTQSVNAIASDNTYMVVGATNTQVYIKTGSSSSTTTTYWDVNGAQVSTIANVAIASAGTPTTIDTIDNTTYRSAKYVVQVTNGTKFQAQEALVVTDGTTATVVPYGIVQTSGNLGVLSATQSGTNVLVQFTAANASNQVRIKKDYIAI